MRPTTLTLEGFQSYLEPQTLDLTGITAAAVTGRVGAGKTTLIDAVVFSLYGRVRYAHAKDSVIHTAAKTMSVELDFTAHDGTWRIRRTMKRTKSGFNSKAYLYRIDPETGAEESKGDSSGNVTPTNAAIRDLIGLDYEAFRATSLIEQGRSGTFSEADPSQRHEIFANIIDLGRYAEAEEKARAERNDLSREIETGKVKLTGHAEALEAQDTVTTDLAAARQTQEQAQRAAEQARTTLDRLTTELEKVTDRWHEAKAAATEHDHAVTAARQRHEHATYRVSAATTALHEARAAITRAAERRTELTEQIGAARQADEQATATIRDQIAAAQASAEKAAATAAQDDPARAALDAARATQSDAQERLEETNAAAESLRERGQVLQGRIGDLTAKRDAARAAYREEQERLSLLRAAHDHGGGSCYACGQSLDPVLIERMAADLTDRMNRISDEGKAHADDLAAAQAQDTDFRAQHDTLRGQHQGHQDRAQRAQLDAQAAQQKIAAAADAEHTRQQAQGTISALETRVQAITQGQSPNAERVVTLEAKIAELDGQGTAREQAVTDAQQDHAQAEADARSATEALTEAQSQDGPALDAIGAEGTRLRAERTTAEEQSTAAQAAAAERAQAVAVLAAEAQRLSTVRAEHTKLSKSLSAQQEELEILNLTVAALSPSGVPQQIMNSEIEVLNQDLDHQLSQLSEGALTAELSTTRQTKSGTVRNDLTLMVTGPDGTRPYETFSGGQKFLTDLALHMALSKLLRDRRGAVMEALFVDEGIGALEGEEKDAAVRGIQSLTHDMFDLSLTVTHDPDVVAAMPERIEVEMVSGSSLARIV